MKYCSQLLFFVFDKTKNLFCLPSDLSPSWFLASGFWFLYNVCMSHLLRTYIFLIPLIVMFLCECAKVVTEGIRLRTWHAGIFKAGGLPSSHSAFVTSLLIVLRDKVGTTSTQFAIAFVFASIVWYDAIVVRREVGIQAEILNRLQNWRHLSERIGHSFVEVICGILFGACITWVGIAVSRM